MRTNHIFLNILFLSTLLPGGWGPDDLHAQETSVMTLDGVIATARERSVQALAAKSNFVSEYWAYRSYQASRLPSLNVYGNLASFDRSLRLLQNYETGEMNYVSNYNLQNSLGLSIRQNVTFTGGVVALSTDLSRIDQFGPKRTNTWYAQPVTFTYDQPIFSFNRFKWEKKIAPKEYELAERKYIESMEEVTLEAVNRYFELLLAKKNHDKARSNFENTSKMYAVASERVKLGSVTRDEYLQLELRMLNDSIAINETSIKVREAQMGLNSHLGYDESFEIDPVLDDGLPEVIIDYDLVMEKALANSSFLVENDIRTLEAESGVAKAKADRGLKMSFHAKFGLSSSRQAIRETYQNLLDQEVVGLSFSIPIFDWGMGKGRVKNAQARADVVRAEVEQSMNDFRRSVFTVVGQFNSQRQQCLASKRAAEIASERYLLMMDKFRNAGASVTELNMAQQENDQAADRHIQDIRNFWNYYYELRKLALYDFIGGADVAVDFRELLK